jgi:hypothetical protein
LTLEKTLKFPFSHQEVLTQIWSDAIDKNAMMAQNNPREVFWTAIDYTANNEKYRAQEGKQWMRDVFENKVFIKMAELYPCYVKFCKESGNNIEDQFTLIKHLTNHESFCKSTQKGDSQSMNKAGFGRCFAFKYETPGANVITIGGKQVSFMNI